MDITGIGSVADLIKDGLDKIFPDPAQAAQGRRRHRRHRQRRRDRAAGRPGGSSYLSPGAGRLPAQAGGGLSTQTQTLAVHTS